jgi:hypothetical protein
LLKITIPISTMLPKKTIFAKTTTDGVEVEAEKFY